MCRSLQNRKYYNTKEAWMAIIKIIKRECLQGATALARELGVTPRYLAMLRQGVRRPSTALAAKLKSAGFKLPRRSRKAKEVR